jgi:hypothetical protein
MSPCYTRHLEEVLRRAGAANTPENRRLLDRAVRETLEMHRADCPDIWKTLKPIMEGKDKRKQEFEEKVTRLLVKYLVTG